MRRDRRFAAVVPALATGSGASLPGPAEYDACLRLFDAPTATPAHILAAHQVAVLDRLEGATAPVLLIDGTHLDFSGHATREPDHGPIGNGGGRGGVAHPTLAVNPADRTAYGLVAQIRHTRPASTTGQGVAARGDRETRLWARARDEIGPAPAGATGVDVMDRGADAFEVLWGRTARGRTFIVRSTHNRALGGGPSGTPAARQWHDALRALPAATWERDVPSRGGARPRRRARSAAVAHQVVLRPPHVRKGEHPRVPVPRTAVRVWEPDPPPGVAPLGWVLLTNRPAGTPDPVRRVADDYACRWPVEEFHTAQKSGLAVEGCRFESGQKAQARLAVTRVVPVWLLNLRLGARDPARAGEPAAAAVPAAWIATLDRLKVRARPLVTARDFFLHLAWLGGYMRDKPDRPPRWQTVWRGWGTLRTVLRYELSTPKM